MISGAGKKNVFVLGMDDFNHRKLNSIEGTDDIEFHTLLKYHEVQGARAYPVDVVLERSRERLRAFPGRVDAIIGWWDFPVTLVLPLLAREFGVPSPSFESVVRCEHKYWNRLLAREAVPESVPAFQAVDPFDDRDVASIDLEPPYWIKPIKSADAELAFRIRTPEDLERFIPVIRKRIGRFRGPFDQLLQHADLPEEVADVGGGHCLVEEEISGRQCTVEGYAHGGNVDVRGIIDSYRYPGVSSFLRYEYPSRLPHRLQHRIAGLSERLVAATGLEDSTWNIEFFVDERSGRISLLEVNPRLSQSHSHMFDLVDGRTNLAVAVELGLDVKPRFPTGEGRGDFACASKFYLRVFDDATVKRVPGQREIERVERRFPGTLVHPTVEEGTRLSDLWGQDSYSYRVADIHMGAQSPRDLLSRFRACRDMLGFEFSRGEPDLAPLPVKPRSSVAPARSLR